MSPDFEPLTLRYVHLPSLTHITLTGLRNPSTTKLHPLLSTIYPTGRLDDYPLERVTLEVTYNELPHNKLRQLRFGYRESTNQFCRGPKPAFEWDVTLASVKSLRRVNVIGTYIGHRRHGQAPLGIILCRKTFESWFPALRSRGILHVHIVIDLIDTYQPQLTLNDILQVDRL